MEHRQFYKMSMYEGSSHVPLLVMGPGVKEQQQIQNVVSLVDIYPTMLGKLNHFKLFFFPSSCHYHVFILQSELCPRFVRQCRNTAGDNKLSMEHAYSLEKTKVKTK